MKNQFAIEWPYIDDWYHKLKVFSTIAIYKPWELASVFFHLWFQVKQSDVRWVCQDFIVPIPAI